MRGVKHIEFNHNRSERGRGGRRGVTKIMNDILECVDEYRNIECVVCEDVCEYDRLSGSGLKFLHLNIRSYNKNFDELLVMLSSISTRFDVIILTETWLAQGDCNLVQIPGYDIYSNYKKRNQNDGVICYVNSKFTIDTQEVSLHESTCLQLNLAVNGERFSILAI